MFQRFWGVKGSVAHVGYEASLQNAEQRAGCQKGSSSGQKELCASNDAPKTDLEGDPTIGAHPLGHELRRQLGAEEAEAENSVAEIVVWGKLAASRSEGV